MNVAEYLLENKATNMPALLTPKTGFSFAELENASECVAQWLRHCGLEKGDRALLCSDNSLFWVAAYVGCLRAGCVAVPVAPSSTPAEFDYIRESTSPAVFFLGGREANRASSLAGHGTFICVGPNSTESDVSNAISDSMIWFSDLVRDGFLYRSRCPAVDDRRDLAAIMFTSGSTGAPRGVMVSHRNIISNTESIVEYMGLSPRERAMAVLPFHYCFGTSLLHTHLRAGGSLVVGEHFLYPDKILHRMAETECSGFAGVPSHLQILLRICGLNETRLPHLRWIQQAGGNLAIPFIRELRRALPSVSLFIMYGQTEATARLSYLPPELLDRKIGSIGKGIPGVVLELLRSDGTSVAPGEVGEIVASGENVAVGYWHNPMDTARCFRNGKLHTGDLATVDEDGYVYIVDRAKDFLKCGGYRVSARQVEDTLIKSEEVVEAAVIAMPDDILGEAVKAFIVPRKTHRSLPTKLEARLVEFCKHHLPKHVVPKQIVFVDSLPKNEAGKVLKQALREHSYPELLPHCRTAPCSTKNY